MFHRMSQQRRSYVHCCLFAHSALQLYLAVAGSSHEPLAEDQYHHSEMNKEQ